MNSLVLGFEWGNFIGYLMVALFSIVGIRLFFYYHSFFFHWPRYRQLAPITTEDVKLLPNIPYIKVQITTKGLPGSTEVIRRGIQNIIALAEEDTDLYCNKLSVEVVTESSEQKKLLEQDFGRFPLSMQRYVCVVPAEYETSRGTKVKARALHYMAELRRQGFNRKPGQTFILHYDEESVMEPDELRKLIHYLATTDKKLTEGPIYYPLEYTNASIICQSMEASRPMGCFECRKVMESGIPLHLHGSNLVVDEELENELGWDIGTLDGQPFIAEDYVFGILAYLRYGSQIFGWHRCVMLEQPPFSLRSALMQRRRWVTGVLQGISMMQQMPEFDRLPNLVRFHLVWGVRYRILTLALGAPIALFALLYLLSQVWLALFDQHFLLMPLPIIAWSLLISFFWINSTFIGAWYNLSSAHQMSNHQRFVAGVKILAIAPLAGILESSIGLGAVLQWFIGNRKVSWQPTPKTKKIDKIVQLT